MNARQALQRELRNAKKLAITAVVERSEPGDLIAMLPDGTIGVFLDDADGKRAIVAEVGRVGQRMMRRAKAQILVTTIEWRDGVTPEDAR